MWFCDVARSALVQRGPTMPYSPATQPRGPISEWYHLEIIDQGKQPLLLLLIALICTFIFIRFSTRLIRRQVRWWPSNINHGDVHVHHVVFGTSGMVVSGIGGFATDGTSPMVEVFAVLFGVGTALVLDEFALIFHLQDVYWSEEGRKSIDAVILATGGTLLVLLGAFPPGLREIGDDEATLRWLAITHVLLVMTAATICFLKGKLWTGVLGIVLSPVVIVPVIGAIRLAKPGSPWARWRYAHKPALMARAMARCAQHDRRWITRKHRIWDFIGGAPQVEPASAGALQPVEHDQYGR
jgi:lysyl-tRNA synthetase, class II